MDEDIVKLPDLDLAQQRFLLSLHDDIVSKEQKERIRVELIKAIHKENMLPFYRVLADQFKWTIDEKLVDEMKQANDAQLKKLNETITEAEEKAGESEVREGFLARADYYCKIGDKAKAVTAFRETFEKTVALGQKLDILFTVIRMGFFWSDFDLVNKNIEKAKGLIDQGGDWDRRNRLKVYEGLYFTCIRKFKEAADLFLEAMATFTSTELFSYQDFIFYTAVVSIVSVDRVTLKTKVIDSPEVLAVVKDIPNLQKFLISLYECNYRQFFESLVEITEQLEKDRYFSPHAKYFCRELRIQAYKQLLDSYRSVKLDSMAKDFGVGINFLDRELSRFISSGRLHCKIDKVGGIVETTRPDAKNALYQDTIRQGDLLLNRVSKLSRIINL